MIELNAHETNLPSHCRLYVILAREAPIGIIFRRGPSKWVQIIHWDTSTDTFSPGQWFHGRIYERRCDLSPDGSLMIYFAQKINPRTIESTYTYAWTAISKPPYLTALALWPKGDCWAGGGLFQSTNTVWLNHRHDMNQAHPDHLPKKQFTITSENGGFGEDDPILAHRMARDGWRQTQELRLERPHPMAGFVTIAPEIYRKQNPQGWQKLTMETSFVGFRFHPNYAFSVRYAEGKDLPLSGAVWADWDQRGRLVFAREGKLFACNLTDNLGEETELADFNANQPETFDAPVWAKRW